ncbi:DUF1772 domain-containing protein [Pelagicoccus albus]|uniref:DUF1772 domain-containing protein n=1 Tax=Pelagicoccus albus TaxID=415222 RepID=A0A7X1E899_9BACT|nr:anthrone oxygenase family protein [Pelagicoccus albus]MBC2604552.1 DUF1772 domain-containing protein [Pelagicoccus albus]
MNILLLNLLLAGLVGTALVGGLLYAFSVCIMKALAGLTDAEGIKAMQTINRVILNPTFFLSFIGTAVLSLVNGAFVLMGWAGDFPDIFIFASAFYLFGVFLVTARGNVPLNHKLDALQAERGSEFWKIYLKDWTRLNHLRTVAATISVFLYGVGFVQYTFQP